MPKRVTRTKTSAPPWWLGGEEECVHCGQLYVYEVEFRCPDCDGPGCPQCKGMHTEGRFVCAGCAATPAEAAHGR